MKFFYALNKENIYCIEWRLVSNSCVTIHIIAAAPAKKRGSFSNIEGGWPCAYHIEAANSSSKCGGN